MRPFPRCGPAALLLGLALLGCTNTQPGGSVMLDRAAPEIQGDDVDGQPMKLSDFRGKVVLLDFWGNW
jgi:cytochrome oxidase Cu insertion factor (SCO1/SenC/PrrC family)